MSKSEFSGGGQRQEENFIAICMGTVSWNDSPPFLETLASRTGGLSEFVMLD